MSIVIDKLFQPKTGLARLIIGITLFKNSSTIPFFKNLDLKKYAVLSKKNNNIHSKFEFSK